MSRDTPHYTVNWRTEWPRADLPIEQVYGVLFNEHGQVLVLNDNGRYNLPGGHPEGTESWLETLERECMEEALVHIREPLFIGYVHVTEEMDGHARHFGQLRFAAAISALLPEAPDPATGRTYKREFHSTEVVAQLLNWGSHGDAQLNDAAAIWHLARQRKDRRTLLNVKPQP